MFEDCTIQYGPNFFLIQRARSTLLRQLICFCQWQQCFFLILLFFTFFFLVIERFGQPEEEVEKVTVELGDPYKRNCTPPKSNPPARVYWILKVLQLFL